MTYTRGEEKKNNSMFSGLLYDKQKKNNKKGKL